ncbi:MAG: hypothetical protein ACTHJL_06900 [Amnibacterium sp.]
MIDSDAWEAVLAEADLPPDPELTDLLAELQVLGAGPVPAPSPRVDALLAGAATTGRRPGRHARRGAIIGALVLVSLGTGVTAAAADPDLRAGAAAAVAAVVSAVHPVPAHSADEPRATGGTPGADRRTGTVVDPSACPSRIPVAPRATPDPQDTPSAAAVVHRSPVAVAEEHHAASPSGGKGHTGSGSDDGAARTGGSTGSGHRDGGDGSHDGSGDHGHGRNDGSGQGAASDEGAGSGQGTTSEQGDRGGSAGTGSDSGDGGD